MTNSGIRCQSGDADTYRGSIRSLPASSPRNRRGYIGPVTVVIAALAVLRFAYREGPPPGHTGGFGEKTCQACHDYNPLNDSLGSLALFGLPDAFSPDSTYKLTIRLTRATLAVGGFQLAARFADSTQAGVLRPVDRSTTTSMGPGEIEYLQHTKAGTGASADDTLAWHFTWRAPGAPAANDRPHRVYFHAAANATNDDNSEFGDHIYTTSDSLVAAQ